MKSEVATELTADELAKIAEMDNPANMENLVQIGRKAAERQVKPEHFRSVFDVK